VYKVFKNIGSFNVILNNNNNNNKRIVGMRLIQGLTLCVASGHDLSS
jgi:hypothetical protein